MILDNIKKDQKQARLSKNKFLASILTTLMAEVSIVGKNKQRETTDEEALQVIGKFAKNAKEVRDLVDDKERIQAEIDIYEAYMPKQMDESQMKHEIVLFVAENPNTIMGQVMQHFSANFKGQYDGKVLSQIVREMI